MARWGCRAAGAAILVGAALAALPVEVGAQAGGAQEVAAVVHAPAGAPETAGAVRAALSRAAARTGARLEGRPFSRARSLLASGAVRAERLDRFARVARMADEGWRGYLEARFTAAAARLGEARSEAAALLDLAGGLEVYADLSLRLGAVELALGREREAALDLRLAARLDPRRAVSDDEFKPAVVARYRAAAAGQRPRWRRRIEVDPAGASIEVDGRASGSAPVEVELEEGPHVIVARAPGRAARAEVIAVEPSEASAGGGGDPALARILLDEDRLAASVARGANGMRIGQRDGAAGEVAEALVTVGELDAVLVVASVWRGGRPALLGQLCRGAPLLCGRRVEIGYERRVDLERAAAELWRAAQAGGARGSLTLLADARLVHREAGPRRGGGGEPPRGWWRSRWLWVGVGGVALSVAAAGLLLGSGDGALEWAPSFDRCEFGGCQGTMRSVPIPQR